MDNEEVEPPFEYQEPIKLGWVMEQKEEKDEKVTFKKQVKAYTENTSIHGIVYVGEDGRSWLERVFWILAIIGGMVLMVIFIRPIYLKWQENPTITSPASTNYPIWNVYFPAVTICSNNKVVEGQLRTVVKRSPWINLTEEDVPDLKTSLKDAISSTILFELQPQHLKEGNVKNATEMLLNEHKKALPRAMQQVMHTCKDIFLMCIWQGEVVNCHDFFSVRKTDNGYCCSFNTLRMSEQFADAAEIEAGVDTTNEDDYGDYYEDYGGYGDYGNDDGGFGWYDYEEYGDGDIGSSTTTEQFNSDGSTTGTTTEPPNQGGTTGTTTEPPNQGGATTEPPNPGGTTTEPTNPKGTTTQPPNPDGSTTEPSNPTTAPNNPTGSTTNPGDGTTATETTETTTESPIVRKKRAAKKFQARQASSTSANIKKEPTKLKKTNAANSMLGLSVVLYPNQKEYSNVVMNNYLGFRALVHSPFDFAEVGGKGFAIEASNEVFVAIGATFTSSSETVKTMPLAKRKCLKHDEDISKYPDVKLEVFLNYSRKACLLECQAREIQSVCGCLPYYYPDFSKLWKADTHCDLNGLRCLANISSNTKAFRPPKEVKIENLIKGAECNCPLDCEETLYTQEVSQAKVFGKGLILETLKSKGNALWQLDQQLSNATNEQKRERIQERINDIVNTTSIVHFYFKEPGIVQYSRDELYGIMDLVAAFGGLIGLCSGFSILSGVEFIYWFTLRPLMDRLSRRKKVKATN